MAIWGAVAPRAPSMATSLRPFTKIARQQFIVHFKVINNAILIRMNDLCLLFDHAPTMSTLSSLLVVYTLSR